MQLNAKSASRLALPLFSHCLVERAGCQHKDCRSIILPALEWVCVTVYKLTRLIRSLSTSRTCCKVSMQYPQGVLPPFPDSLDHRRDPNPLLYFQMHWQWQEPYPERVSPRLHRWGSCLACHISSKLASCLPSHFIFAAKKWQYSLLTFCRCILVLQEA